MQREPQQVTTKNLKKVEAGKRLAAHNRRQREKKREEQAQAQKGRVSQYYNIGAVLAVGVIGGLCCYIYRTKKGEAPSQPQPPQPPQQRLGGPRPQNNKFEMD